MKARAASSPLAELVLGTGLIRLGRAWGVAGQGPLSAADGRRFVEGAIAAGVSYFDTAPAYGESEQILGSVLAGLSGPERARLTIATKVGEHWVPDAQATMVDHSPGAVRASIERSLALLGRVDVLQVHKASAELLAGDMVAPMIDIMRSYGIACLGVSVSDMEAFRHARELGVFTHFQMPYNKESRGMERAIASVGSDRRGVVVVNRPLAMGALAREGSDAVASAFAWLRARLPAGIILTGTANLKHLAMNARALQDSRPSAS